MMRSFKQEPNGQVKEDLKKIDEKIRNEKDAYKRAKLYESKSMYHLFNNEFSHSFTVSFSVGRTQ